MKALANLQPNRRRLTLVLTVVLGLVTLVGVTTSSGCSRPDPEALVEEHCVDCHALAIVTASHKTHDDWEVTVNRMIGLGAELNEREAQEVVDYLSDTYGGEGL